MLQEPNGIKTRRLALIALALFLFYIIKSANVDKGAGTLIHKMRIKRHVFLTSPQAKRGSVIDATTMFSWGPTEHDTGEGGSAEQYFSFIQ